MPGNRPPTKRHQRLETFNRRSRSREDHSSPKARWNAANDGQPSFSVVSEWHFQISAGLHDKEERLVERPESEAAGYDCNKARNTTASSFCLSFRYSRTVHVSAREISCCP